MQRAVLLNAAAALLLGPTMLAFFAGGYFDGPRLIGAFVAWVLVLLMALAAPQPLPRSTAGRVALGGLVLITVYTAISFAWAPLASAATDNLVRLILYVGVMIAAIGLLRDRLAMRAVEPVLALGALVVIGYGLSGRLLPGMIHMLTSLRAGGRLHQPITYWNAEGALAAMGLVLCARLAGDASRPVLIRGLAAAGCAPLGMGTYLSYSRGAIAAAAIGLLILVAAAPSKPQLRAALIALGAALVAAVSSNAFPGVASLSGDLASRETGGAITLAILVSVMLATGLAQAWLATAELRGRVGVGRLRSPRRALAVAMVALPLVVGGLPVSGVAERGNADRPSKVRGPARLVSIDSSRYDYWRVGVDAFRASPLEGVGSGGFRVVWYRERLLRQGVLEVHSLPLEMAVELGIVGLLGFGLFLGGTGVAARRALRRQGAVAAGPLAVGLVYLIHATIDWDWQLPAVTAPALVMVGVLIALSEAPADSVTPGLATTRQDAVGPTPAPAPVSRARASTAGRGA